MRGLRASANPNQYNTPLGSTFSAEQTVTVVDSRHPLCGRTLPLVGIANKPYLGRYCVVWLRPDVERLMPVSATDLEFDPRSVSRTPLCLEAPQYLLEVFEEACHLTRYRAAIVAVGNTSGASVVKITTLSASTQVRY